MKGFAGKIKNAACNVALCLASLALTLFILEICFAMFHPYRITDSLKNTQYHPVMGWTNIPDIHGKAKLLKTANEYFQRTHNSHGLRSSREIGYAKPPGVRRILLVGDSFFWGFGVDDADVLSEVLQQMTGDRVEIINGAVTGYGTDQELLWLVNEGLKYKPDLVICGMFPDNDLAEIATSMTYLVPKPYYSLENGRLRLNNVPVPNIRELYTQLPDSWFRRVKKFLRHNLHTYQFVVQKLHAIPRIKNVLLTLGLADDFSACYKGLIMHKLTDEVQRADLSDAIIKEMKRVCEYNEAIFLLFFIPVKEQEPDFPAGYSDCRGKSAESCDINAGFALNSANRDYLQKFAAGNDVAFLDFLPVVRKNHREGRLLYYHGKEDHHWSALGHKAAAESIYQYLWGPR